MAKPAMMQGFGGCTIKKEGSEKKATNISNIQISQLFHHILQSICGANLVLFYEKDDKITMKDFDYHILTPCRAVFAPQSGNYILTLWRLMVTKELIFNP